MIIVEGQARVPDGAYEKAKDAMAVMVKATREEPGCIDYGFSQDAVDPNLFRFIELWEDKAALVNHFTQPHSVVFGGVLAEMGKIDVQMRTFAAEPTDFPSR